MTRDLHTSVTVDHTNELRNISDYPYNRDRTIHIRYIKEQGDCGYLVQAWGSTFPQDGGGGYQGHITVNVATVSSGINDLRTVWQQHVVERSERRDGRNCFPFVDDWDLSGSADRHRFDDIGLRLARAGYTLFSLLFLNGDPGPMPLSLS